MAAPALAATTTVVPADSPVNALPEADPLTPRLFTPASQTTPPQGFKISARQAIRVADRTDAVREARAKTGKLTPIAYISPLQLPEGSFYHWDVVYKDGSKDVVEVEMTGDGRVLLLRKAPDVGWPLLLGLRGVLGGKLNAPWIWLPLCLIFLLPFLDPRRPFRLLHLDLLMLLGFGLSQVFFTAGKPDVSVPLVYPFLLYAAGRAAWAAFRPSRRRGQLMPLVSTRFLIVGVVFLLACRIAFGLADSGVFDISTAGAIGADRIEHGLPLYEDNEAHGDTYGPVNYLLYVPFELLFPFEPPAGDAPRYATLSFDLLIALGLFLLGRSLRPGTSGTRLGAGLAWAWAAFPYSALVIASNTNDALVPLFVVYALLAIRSPVARGLLTGIGTMAKFAPALVAPALVTGRGPFRLRPVLAATAAYVAVCVALVVPFLPDGGLREFWNTTLGFQLHRTSPLSIWTRDPWLDWLRPVVTALAVALAVASAFVPRRRTTAQLAALCAAIFAVAQVSANFWLYFYVVWFAPFLFVALFEEYRDLGPSAQGDERLGEARQDLASGVGHRDEVFDADPQHAG
jgi:hypothetical protein